MKKIENFVLWGLYKYLNSCLFLNSLFSFMGFLIFHQILNIFAETLQLEVSVQGQYLSRQTIVLILMNPRVYIRIFFMYCKQNATNNNHGIKKK